MTAREEKLAFEAFVDFVIAALAEDPSMHVYHYAPYEPSALKRLMGRHGTREEEIDRLLSEKVLVDLYAVTVQALRTSKPGYSIKQVEEFYMDAREQEVTEGGDSIVRFEEWLDTGEQSLLDAIEAYNEVDCLSTVEAASMASRPPDGGAGEVRRGDPLAAINGAARGLARGHGDLG